MIREFARENTRIKPYSVSKEALRNYIKRRKESISPGVINDSNNAINKNIMALNEYKQAKTLFCFIGREDEIDTCAIIEDALHSGKRVGVPRIVSPGVMEVAQIYGLASLMTNRFGILEPAADSPIISKEEIDFAIVPCLSCDKQGNRLGFGGGYYDRYLAGTGFIKAALCREPLRLDEVPAESWDVPMNIVVMENRVDNYL